MNTKINLHARNSSFRLRNLVRLSPETKFKYKII